MEPTTSKEGTGGEKSKNSKETDTSAAPSEDSKKSLSKFFKFNNKGDKDKDKEEKKKQPIPAKLMAKGTGELKSNLAIRLGLSPTKDLQRVSFLQVSDTQVTSKRGGM